MSLPQRGGRARGDDRGRGRGFPPGQRGDHRGGGAGRGDHRGGGDYRGGGRGGDYRGGGRGGDYRGGGRGGDHRGGGRGGGDYRGRGRGGRSFSPVRLDVCQLAQDVNCQNVAQRKSRGQVGQVVKLVTNHYPMKFKDIKCVHYDIAINLHRHDGQLMAISGQGVRKLRKERQMDNIRIVEQMVEEWPEVFRPGRAIPYVFDGNKNLYCASDLNIGREQIARTVVITLDGFSQQTYEVRIKFAKNVSMNIINQFLTGTVINIDLAEYREALQVLDIVMRYYPQKIRVPVGRNLYSRSEQDRQDIGQNALIVFGHHQSVQLTQSGLTLNVDRTTTPFRSEGPLVDFIARELKRDNIKQVPFTSDLVQRLNIKLKDLKIFTEHIVIAGRPQKRKHIIDRMINKKPSEQMMSTEAGDEISIQQYFAGKYGKQLEYPNLPLIQIKGGTEGNRKYVPVEVCQVYPDQAMPRRLINPDIQRQIVEATNSQIPKKRFEKIHHSLNDICRESRELMANFGVTICDKPIKLDGRQLPAPKVLGDRNRLNQTVPLNSYLFYNLSAAVKPHLKVYFENFFNGPEALIATAGRIGLTIRRINTSGSAPPREVGTATDDELKSYESSMRAFESKMKIAKKVFPDLQMIFVVIPKVPELYEYIKLLADIEYGIPQQCILDQNFIQPKPGYFHNFLRKTNAKLNGRNQVVVERPRFASAQSVDTMVVGVDVTHPGYHNPLANERVISSIAAVVGSYDKEFTKFVASVSAQPMNIEIIADFDILIRNLLKGFFRQNKTYPKHIVVFRDGVSDSQFQAVIDNEIPLIRKAYIAERVKIEPLITAFVVQKGHNTRFMPLVVEKDFKGKDILNIKAGTVVDHTITNPLHDEFHLCSHNGMLGTSRHAKYIVLRDDHKLSADDKQKLAYHMCYGCCRCATPISIPVPVKYADLAAYRTKQHTAAKNIEYQLTGPPDETDDQKRQREANNIRHMNNEIKVHDNIVFLPYYC